MAEISNILQTLRGTREGEILLQMEELYKNISELQSSWYKKSAFLCPEGCGKCCHNFEPDMMEGEVLYMAAWLIENKREIALKISEGKFPFENGKTCPFHDFENPYHCSIYGGRALICRLFGASCIKYKDGKNAWKPCKFIPEEKLKSYNPLLTHRQYSQEEAEKILHAMPPAMSDMAEQVVSISPDSASSRLLREVLPEKIAFLLWILDMNGKTA